MVFFAFLGSKRIAQFLLGLLAADVVNKWELSIATVHEGPPGSCADPWGSRSWTTSLWFFILGPEN